MRAEQKIDEMGSEIRRQHEQYIEVLQSKDDSIVLANDKARDLQIQLTERETAIRCMETETAD